MNSFSPGLRAGLLVIVLGYLAAGSALIWPEFADSVMTAALVLGAAVTARALFKGGMRPGPAWGAGLLAVATFALTTYLGTRLQEGLGPDALFRLTPVLIPALNGFLASLAIIWTRHKAQNGGWPFVGRDVHTIRPR